VAFDGDARVAAGGDVQRPAAGVVGQAAGNCEESAAQRAAARTVVSGSPSSCVHPDANFQRRRRLPADTGRVRQRPGRDHRLLHGRPIGWRIAAAHPERIAALGGFHSGGLVTEEPDSPHLSASELRAEVFLGHADNDRSMTPENIATIESALEEANVTYRSQLFEGAAHRYAMADTPAYDQAAAERHFTELFALLDRTVST
jgi:hypothetical protein